MAASVLSFRIEPEFVSRLDALAAATDRDRQYHLKRAVARYLEDESWHVKAIAEGIAEAEAGHLTDLEIIKRKWVARAEAASDTESGK
ncbi:CopG family ribbon-helix-helix protein [Pseudomonas sp. DC3000-4b1]|uniref:CopG family ribbon-helix-helix protein n=1 Tax=unclassified Pseudomonas TaxID=196821 RepID=UPI003CEBCBF1